MTNWYDAIEPEIRDLVELLRDNGFNTTGSCGHEMWVEIDLGNNLGEVEDLATFLVEHGYENFTIQSELYAGNAPWTRRCIVQLRNLMLVKVTHYMPNNQVIESAELVDKNTGNIRTFRGGPLHDNLL